MLHIHELCKQFGGKLLFENADAHIGYRSRVALIGPNGAGKSTLIKIILGLADADSGHVSRSKNLAIGYLAQEVPKISGRSVLAETMRLDGRREKLMTEREELETLFATNPNPSEAELLRYGRIMEELEHLDEYRLEARAKSILAGMGFATKDFNRNLEEFSGGWLMRVALSRILLMDPDLLLLDEPTNHLDLESQLWLEEFLASHQGAMILISHDTAFLNRIVTDVMEIDQKKLWTYKGNLDSFAVQKQERLTLLQAQYAGQQAKIAELEGFIRRFGAKATKARQAQSRQKQLDKMERIELTEDQAGIRFRFPPAPHSGKDVFSAKHATVSYGDKVVFKDLDWVIPRGSRTAIVGVNGAGKTTLLKLLAGKIEPGVGEVKVGHEVKIGYYAQLQSESLDPRKTILEELSSAAPFDMPIARIRGVAGAFLFTGDAVEKYCSVLSGGEKARVALAKLLLQPSNFLVLDEPTNHLDADSRDVIQEALENYSGTLCLVSHDRDFIAPLADFVLEITPTPQGSRVTQVLGGYEDYLARKQREAAQAVSSGKPPETRKSEDTKPKNSAPSNNKVRTWQREHKKLEEEIAKLETEQKEIHAGLADDATYSDKDKTLTLVGRQSILERKLKESYERWEELSTLLEGAPTSP